MTTFALFRPDNKPVIARAGGLDVLPAATLTYALTDAWKARAHVAQTVSRPDFRELSPATFNDVTGGRQVFGNPDLEVGRVQHADLRVEGKLKGLNVAAAVFGKRFEKPIEQTIVLSAQPSVTFDNAISAHNIGGELEITGDLETPIARARFGANGAVIYSEVQLEDGLQTSDRRALQGQSPYLLNLMLGVEREGLELTALYNLNGPRITEVGALGAPDVYLLDTHALDVVFKAPLTKHLTLGLKANNLLDLPRTSAARRSGILRNGSVWSRVLSFAFLGALKRTEVDG